MGSNRVKKSRTAPKWHRHVRACAVRTHAPARELIAHFRTIEQDYGLSFAANTADAKDQHASDKSILSSFTDADWGDAVSVVNAVLSRPGSNSREVPRTIDVESLPASPATTVRDINALFVLHPLDKLRHEEAALSKTIQFLSALQGSIQDLVNDRSKHEEVLARRTSPVPTEDALAEMFASQDASCADDSVHQPQGLEGVNDEGAGNDGDDDGDRSNAIVAEEDDGAESAGSFCDLLCSSEGSDSDSDAHQDSHSHQPAIRSQAIRSQAKKTSPSALLRPGRTPLWSASAKLQLPHHSSSLQAQGPSADLRKDADISLTQSRLASLIDGAAMLSDDEDSSDDSEGIFSLGSSKISRAKPVDSNHAQSTAQRSSTPGTHHASGSNAVSTPFTPCPAYNAMSVDELKHHMAEYVISHG